MKIRPEIAGLILTGLVIALLILLFDANVRLKKANHRADIFADARRSYERMTSPFIPYTNVVHVDAAGRASNHLVRFEVGDHIQLVYISPTNIVISNDYSGTIQIGTNLLKLSDLEDWFVIKSSMNRSAEAWPFEINSQTQHLPADLALTLRRRYTYTVDVANGLWTSTNVIDIHRCSEFCTRMRYVENGLTNDFHAAFVSYTVKTNAP